MSKKAPAGKQAAPKYAGSGAADGQQQFWKALKSGHCHQLSDLLFVPPAASEDGTAAVEQRRPHALEWANSHNDKGLSPLTFAIAAGHEADICELLLRAGAKVNDADGSKDRNTPLLAAAGAEDDIVIQTLIRHHADVSRHDAHGRNVLHIAARNGSRHLFTYFLLETGALTPAASLANLLKQDVDGTSPVHYALGEVGGCIPIAMEALHFLAAAEEPGAAVRALALTSRSLATPLHVLVSSGVSNAAVAQVAAIAVKLGADVWARDDEDNSPIHIAASLHSSAEVMLTLLAGVPAADVTEKRAGSGGLNLLHFAASCNRKALLSAVLAHYGKGTLRLDALTAPVAEAAVDAVDTTAAAPAGGHQAVEVAIFAGHDAIADLLVQFGAPDVRERAKARRDEIEAASDDDDGNDGAAPRGDFSGHGSTTIGASRVQAARKSRSATVKKKAAASRDDPQGSDGDDDGAPPASEAEAIQRGKQAALEKRQKGAEQKAAADSGPSFWVKALVMAIFLSTLLPMLDLLINGSSNK